MKNILVNLTSEGGNAVTVDYAISFAAAFESHLFGAVFAYVPTLGRSLVHTTAARLLEAQRQTSATAAQAAVTRFENAARGAGVSAATRVFMTTLPGASDIFGPLARRFDLAIVAQPEPKRIAPEDLIIGAVWFRPAGDCCSLHSQGPAKARSRAGVLGRKPRGRPRAR